MKERARHHLRLPRACAGISSSNANVGCGRVTLADVKSKTQYFGGFCTVRMLYSLIKQSSVGVSGRQSVSGKVSVQLFRNVGKWRLFRP